HSVLVGGFGRLAFEPNHLNVNVGDTVVFDFLGQNHTLTQSSLENPCTDDNGFSTGFKQFNPKSINGKFIIEYFVNVPDPQWFYCAQVKPSSHCRAGMVFALNAGRSMDSFISNAVQSSITSTNSSVSVPLPSLSTVSTIIASTTSSKFDSTSS
ncbi:Cupredoxin, partial [Xylogone sp. PMI_703]